MKKNLIYIITGVLIGSLIYNGIGFAKSTLIEVEKKSLKYYFNGEQKAPAEGEEGFIYNSRTYVPIRFISEALGKDVAWDGEANRISINDRIKEDAAITDNASAQANATISNIDDDYKRYVVYDNEVHTIYASGKESEVKALDDLNNMDDLLSKIKFYSDEKTPKKSIGVYKQYLYMSIPCYDSESLEYYDAFFKYNMQDNTYSFIQNEKYDNSTQKTSYLEGGKLIIDYDKVLYIYYLDIMKLTEIDTVSMINPIVYGNHIYYFTKDVHEISPTKNLYRQNINTKKVIKLADMPHWGYLKVVDDYIYCIHHSIKSDIYRVHLTDGSKPTKPSLNSFFI